MQTFLSVMITYDDFQLNKSAVLRKAIEYIKHLQNVNNRLKQENLALRVVSTGHKGEIFNHALVTGRNLQQSF